MNNDARSVARNAARAKEPRRWMLRDKRPRPLACPNARVMRESEEALWNAEPAEFLDPRRNEIPNLNVAKDPD